MVAWELEEAATLVPIVLALVQAVKVAGLPSRLAPIASVVLGPVVFWLAEQSFGTSLPDRLGAFVLPGILVGLAASGLWSGGKTVLEQLPAEASPAPEDRV